MEVDRPIIIYGTGRCGTTIFHRMFSMHPEVAWLSDLCERHPNKPELNRRLMQALEYPILNNRLRKRYGPGECYGFWEHHCRGFRDPCKDLMASDLSIKSKHNLSKIMSRLTTRKRHRLLTKITGWPRLGLLSEIFPQARFINIIRDGRGVANSLINIGWWMGWTGPENWRWGPLSAAHNEEWFSYNQSFVVLAAIQWKILMDASENAKKLIDGSKLLEIKYEQLCSDPINLFKKIVAFSELEWTTKFEKQLSAFNLNNANFKWESELNSTQKGALNEVLEHHLTRYGYL